jgi:hypothetical protein
MSQEENSVRLEKGPDGVYQAPKAYRPKAGGKRPAKDRKRSPPAGRAGKYLSLEEFSLGPVRMSLYVEREALVPLSFGMAALGFLVSLYARRARD